MCAERGWCRIRLRHQHWKTFSFISKAMVRVHVSALYRTGSMCVWNRRSSVSGWMLDFQIPRWRLLMQARNGHTPVDLWASTTISLHMGAEVAEATLHLVARS